MAADFTAARAMYQFCVHISNYIKELTEINAAMGHLALMLSCLNRLGLNASKHFILPCGTTSSMSLDGVGFELSSYSLYFTN